MMNTTPLAEQIRPNGLDQVVGQSHLLKKEGLIKTSIRNKKALSIIFWGPPGCGKTTLARLYANAFGMELTMLSAVFSGVADLKKVVESAKKSKLNNPLFHQGTLLFVDEIHRFNKSQQDAFLPFLEDGTLTLIGATTENPSFHLNNALLSRVRVLELNSLSKNDLADLIRRYETLHGSLPIDEEAKQAILDLAEGDGRYLFNLIENLQGIDPEIPLNKDELADLLQRRRPLYDRSGEQHYNLISALHKSVRGSDPDAALYWLARMLQGGEEPLFLARRLIRMAIEDVGLADPNALTIAIAARDTYQMLGSPEGELALAQVVVYLALAPKSNAIYTAFKQAISDAKETGEIPPPKHILNAPTKMMKGLGYGKGYEYDHDTVHGFSGQNYFPEGMDRPSYYEPKERGFEREMCKRLEYFQKLRKNLLQS